MGELARWSLKVRRETDIALRAHLATRGSKKGDLSKFVEDAVNREIFRETVRDTQAHNADLDPAEVEALVATELEEASKDFWSRR